MPTLITISTASINYTSGTTDCQCSVAVDVPTIGTTYVGRSVSLASHDLGPDWTDADLCAAVAVKLEVPVSDVSVAPGPAAWARAVNAPALATTEEGAALVTEAEVQEVPLVDATP